MIGRLLAITPHTFQTATTKLGNKFLCQPDLLQRPTHKLIAMVFEFFSV